MQGHPPPQGPHPYNPAQVPPAKSHARSSEDTRRIVGIIFYSLFMLAGAVLVLLLFIVPAVTGTQGELEAMGIGAVCALPPLMIYLWIPWILDRYDPEPWWALALVLAWGGVAAIGFSGLINTIMGAIGTEVGGRNFGRFIGACLSAPLVEEFWKGLAIFAMFYFLKREFDGVVDGIIYATFVALGFAAIENIVYYARAWQDEGRQEGVLVATIMMRGILSPWGHPLYTSMTGIGFGLARERAGAWKWIGPIGGYLAAAFLHFVWNFAATISNMLVIVMLPLWILVVLTFLVIIVLLVRRKGRIIRENLKDEVLLGFMTPFELDMTTSAFGTFTATFKYGGSSGREFIRAAARLALSKWHTVRANKERKATVSAEWIVPLRQQLGQLREQVARSLGRPVEQPRAWVPRGK